jgi:glutaredoxin 3
MKPFTIYSKPSCPYCVKIKQVLEFKKFPHVVYTLGQDFTKEEFYTQFGEGSTFPQVMFGEEHLGGCTESVKYLREKNLL